MTPNLNPDAPYMEEIIRLYELQLLSTASNFSIWESGGRAKTAKALAELFFGLTRSIKPHTFIEAGAKTADTSLRVRSLSSDTDIYAFEANPYNHKRYSASQPFSNNRVDYIHKAIAGYDGTTTFNVQKTVSGEEVSPFTGQNSLLKRNDDRTTYEEVTVPCTRLDTQFPDAPENTIWVDVEGATAGVIEGGRSLLRNTRAAIVEMSDKQHWEGEWLSTRVIRELYLIGLIPVARDFEYASQYNVVFVHRDLVDGAMARHELAYYFSVLSNR